MIWPQPKLKPVNTRFRATVSNIIWCALVLTVFVVADHRGSFSAAAAYGQTVAVFWALPCFIFLGIVTGTSKWMRRD